MGMPAETTLEIREFPGLVLNVDSHDLQPGAAQVQVNIASDRVAELKVRAGLREVTFES